MGLTSLSNHMMFDSGILNDSTVTHYVDDFLITGETSFPVSIILRSSRSYCRMYASIQLGGKYNPLTTFYRPPLPLLAVEYLISCFQM